MQFAKRQFVYFGPRALKSSVKLVVAIAAMQLVVAILHQVLVLGVASAMRGTNIRAVNENLERLPLELDAVHTHLALSVITSVSPHGIAVAGAPGEWLHGALPSVFLDPQLVTPGVWISAVLSRGSSLPGLFSARLTAEVLLIVLGGFVVQLGLRAHRIWYLVKHPLLTISLLGGLGLFMQAQGIWGVLRMTPTVAELEVLGLGYLARILLTGAAENYPWLVYNLIPVLAMGLIVLSALTVAPCVEWLAERAVHLMRAIVHQKGTASAPREIQRPARTHTHQILVGLAFMLVVSAIIPRTTHARSSARYSPPRGTAHRGEAQVAVQPTPAAVEISSIQQPTPTATPTLAPSPIANATAAPTATPTPPLVTAERFPATMPMVRVQWSPARQHFVLTDSKGELFKIRAINYNTHYTTLPKEEQLRILRRDFQKMREAGANVITGYGTFDETTLEVAKEYGISVIMPFVPDLTGDYVDSAYREQVIKSFDQFRQRYEKYDSLLMWNYDDEPLHNMIERVQRPPDQVQAFADFLIELSQYAYRTDRYHRPSWLKEPRDWYLDIFANSVNRARTRARASAQPEAALDPNVYAIFARSAYGAPLDIQEWLPRLSNRIEREMAMPFAVGEYGVLGVDRSERSYHLLQIWQDTQQATAIGAGVYTYGPFQPDPNDLTDPAIAAQLQLVDENAVPVDDAWSALAGVWRAQADEEEKNRVRTTIPLAVPEFQGGLERYGGYPTSGPIEEGTAIKQYFVEGKRDGRRIAYTLAWNENRNRVEFAEVDRVIFNELGDYALGGPLLVEYMNGGGYARFGAPTSDPSPLQGAPDARVFQVFSKGWRLIQRVGQ